MSFRTHGSCEQRMQMLWCDESLPKSAEILRTLKIFLEPRNQEPILSPKLLNNLSSWFLGLREILRFLKMYADLLIMSLFASCSQMQSSPEDMYVYIYMVLPFQLTDRLSSPNMVPPLQKVFQTIM